MFLSQVELPWDVVRNPYDIHRNLWRLFPGEARETRASENEARQGFLFRIEAKSTGRPARLLVQSRSPPAAVEGLNLLGSKAFNPAPGRGQRLAFVLTANPVKTIADAQRAAKPGKQSEKCRVPLIKEDDQRQWLARKLGEAATVEAVDVLPHEPIYFRKGSRSGKLATCTYEGILHVSSAEALCRLLENGIGHGKAFGCGLLLVRRT